MFTKMIIWVVLSVLFLPATAYAAGTAGGAAHGGAGAIMAMFALLLVVGKIGSVIERRGYPAVIGELFMGIVLSAIGFMGLGLIDSIRSNEIIAFMAQLGAVLLLFSIGLESNLTELKRVGVRATGVALLGVVAPFTLGGFVLAPLLFPDAGIQAHLFIGASMVATSVGITMSVFKGLGIQRTRAAQTVLGAAVIDDVLGLIVLAVVSSMAAGGSFEAGMVISMVVKSFGFLAAALLIGRLFAKRLSKALSAIHTGIGMKITLALGPALLFAYFAELVGLEPIIGAFAAGLLLDQVHFRVFDVPTIVDDLRGVKLANRKDSERVQRIIRKHTDMHIEDLIAGISSVFVPVFFVYTGLLINVESLLNPRLYLVAAGIAAVAILTKMVAGIAAQGEWREKLLVGAAMVPRGEVGLIFAAVGQQVGAINQEIFSTIVLVVIITTFVGPVLIKRFSEEKTELRSSLRTLKAAHAE